MEKKILTTAFQVKDWFNPKRDIYSFDWETTGLNYLEMEPVGVSFCDGQKACYIDLWENQNAEEILKVLGQVFSAGLFIAHSAKFDIKCTRKFVGQYPANVFCTHIGSFLLDENRLSHKLKILVVQDLGVPLGEVQTWELASQAGYSSPVFHTYAMNDAIWAFQLFQKYSRKLSEEGLNHVFYDIEMPFVYVAADMEINGVKVDMKRLDKLEFDTRNKLIELEDRMFASIGMKVKLQTRMFGLPDERLFPKNLRSSPQLIKIIEKNCGITIPKKKDKDGKYKKSVSKEILLQLKGKHVFIDELIDYKKVRKLYDSYIIPTYQLVDADGRLRPSFGIVKTGRTNARNPNIQQLPRLNKRFPKLDYREILVAEDGSQLVGGDYSGQELRVLGEVSQDDTIIHAFRNNLDLHLITANYIFNLNISPDGLRNGTSEHKSTSHKFDSERYKAKNGVNFPIVYGSTEYGIAHNMGVEVYEAKRWIDKFFELYPKVLDAIEETKLELEESLFASTMMGRKRRFPNYKILPKYAPGKKPSKLRAIRQAFNFKIQGFSADQIKIAAAKAWKAGLKILMLIHDELVVESTNPEQDAKVLKFCMETAVSLSVPFVADIKIGKRYSDVK